MRATLSGHLISSALVHLPRIGVWVAELVLADPVDLTGAVSVALGDLTLAGSVVRGGSVEGSSAYLVTGGAGGWRKPIAARAYRNDLGVKASTVLVDAARNAGEQLSITAPDRVLGPAFVRVAGMAWNVLSRLAPSWWMDAAGVTQVGNRPGPAVSAPFQLIRWDRRAGMREIATETPSAFAPGALLEGAPIEEVVVHVEHAALRLRVRAS